MLDNGPTGAGESRASGDLPESTTPDYQQLMRRVPAIIYVSEPGESGRWLFVGPQIKPILGYTPQQWCADPMLWRRRLHPDDVERALAVEDVALSTAAGERHAPVEYRLFAADGRTVWVRDEALLLADDSGTLHWHGLLLDITDRKLAELALARASAQHAAAAALGAHALEDSSPEELAEEALSAATDLLGVEIGTVLMLTDDRQAFTHLAVHGLPPAWPQATGSSDPALQAGYTLAHGRVVVSDWTTETRFERSPAMIDAGVASGLTVVVEGRRGPFGVIGLHSTRPRDYSQHDLDFAQALANVLGGALDRRMTEDHIRHRALHDPLTGLPNRLLFMDRLDQASARVRRHRGTAAILFLDLDRFKLVNESLGHDIGDELLAGTALRLKQTVRATDTVARFGADEFAVLLEEIGGEHDAVDMAERIASVFARPFVLQGAEHFVTHSIGIALAHGGERAVDVIRDAEAAMHRAKERGRARYELFDEGLRSRAISRLRVENDLRRALERDELVLEYQPIVALHDRSIAGVEALVRWEHPDRGRVAPAEFIPVAEDSGLIEPIGRWVLERACRQAAAWYQMRPDERPISVAVNLSAVEFENRQLVDTVADALRTSGLEPGLLALELTESVMLGDADELMRTLAGLKELGVEIVLDDFGTGYSSLSYLTRLPLDALKVDRSFIDGLGTEPRDTAITEAIIAMSHALSLRVVGEGAETPEHVDALARLGCDQVQGFHFSCPVPPARITQMVQQGPDWAARPRRQRPAA